jgi:hypothetical protein
MREWERVFIAGMIAVKESLHARLGTGNLSCKKDDDAIRMSCDVPALS